MCDGGHTADRITFLEPVLNPERIVPDFDREPDDRADRFPAVLVLVAGLPVLLLVALAGALLRRG